MQSLSSFFEDNKPLASVIILAALLVLIGIVFLLYRVVFGRRLRTATGGRARQPRLGIVDAFDLDRQRQLVLVRRDNVEHLIMIGGPNDVVVESSIVRAQAAGASAPGRDKELTLPPGPAAPQLPAGPPSLAAPPLAPAPTVAPPPFPVQAPAIQTSGPSAAPPLAPVAGGSLSTDRALPRSAQPSSGEAGPAGDTPPSASRPPQPAPPARPGFLQRAPAPGPAPSRAPAPAPPAAAPPPAAPPIGAPPAGSPPVGSPPSAALIDPCSRHRVRSARLRRVP